MFNRRIRLSSIDLKHRSGVPEDARDRIEELMDMTAKDPSMAAELVSELQRWDLWDSYQDRFLKLFRKL